MQFKTEAIDIDGPAWSDRREVEWQVARWAHWYGNLPPIEYEHAHRQALTVTPNPEVA